MNIVETIRRCQVLRTIRDEIEDFLDENSQKRAECQQEIESLLSQLSEKRKELSRLKHLEAATLIGSITPGNASGVISAVNINIELQISNLETGISQCERERSRLLEKHRQYQRQLAANSAKLAQADC